MPSKTYQLGAKVDGRWCRVCLIEAASHPEALRQAIARLQPEHYDKQIRLQQVNHGPGGSARKPPARGG